MPTMFVTLDVSKLSGWLNADARCREERREYTKQSEVRARRRGGGGPVAAQVACTGRAGLKAVQGRGARRTYIPCP